MILLNLLLRKISVKLSIYNASQEVVNLEITIGDSKSHHLCRPSTSTKLNQPSLHFVVSCKAVGLQSHGNALKTIAKWLYSTLHENKIDPEIFRKNMQT